MPDNKIIAYHCSDSRDLDCLIVRETKRARLVCVCIPLLCAFYEVRFDHHAVFGSALEFKCFAREMWIS